MRDTISMVMTLLSVWLNRKGRGKKKKKEEMVGWCNCFDMFDNFSNLKFLKIISR